MKEAGKIRKGFAAMDPKKVSEIASKGGKAAHVKGTAHEWTSEEARAAGQKGGAATHINRGPQKVQDTVNEEATSNEEGEVPK